MDYPPNTGFDSNTPLRYVFSVWGVRINDPLHNFLLTEKKRKKEKEGTSYKKKITIDRLQSRPVLIYLSHLL